MQIQVPPGSTIRIDTPDGREPLTIAAPSVPRGRVHRQIASAAPWLMAGLGLVFGYVAAHENDKHTMQQQPFPAALTQELTEQPARIASQPGNNPFGLKP